jgi:hypothetical protein
MADDNHREPPWVMFLSGDEEAKPVVAQLIRDAGFDPVDLGGIGDSQLQDPGSALWTCTLTHDEATALVARIKSGDTAAADPLTAPFEKFRDHAPDDRAFFLEHLSRAVFEAGIWQVVQDKWDGIREAFHGFDRRATSAGDSAVPGELQGRPARPPRAVHPAELVRRRRDHADRYRAHAEDDDFAQPGIVVRDVMDDAARDRLAGNTVAQLRNGVTESVLQRAFGYLRKVEAASTD